MTLTIRDGYWIFTWRGGACVLWSLENEAVAHLEPNDDRWIPSLWRGE